MSRNRRGRNVTSPRPNATVRSPPPPAPPNAASGVEVRQPVALNGVRPTSITCDWCAQPTIVKPRGRVPRWCSETCRHRSWEQGRAAASGRSAIQIVERLVQAPAPPAPEQPSPTPIDWPETLGALAAQLDSGRIYDRDLVTLSKALSNVFAAYERHPGVRRQR